MYYDKSPGKVLLLNVKFKLDTNWCKGFAIEAENSNNEWNERNKLCLKLQTIQYDVE